MAIIHINKFGGMAPSIDAKQLGSGQATLAQDVELRFGNLRPSILPVSVATGVTAGQTLYKFSRESTALPGFLTKPDDVDFARGPIASDATERTYFTGDGYPKVIDIDGIERRLGVPRPASAPTTTLVPVDEFTVAEANAAYKQTTELIGNLVVSTALRPSTGLPAENMAPLIASDNSWDLLFPVPGTVTDGVFRATDSTMNILTDRRLNGRAPTAEGPGNYTVRLPMLARGLALATDLYSQLEALIKPNTVSTPLLTAPQLDDMMDSLNAYIATNSTFAAEKIARLLAIKTEFVYLSGGSSPEVEAIKAQVAAFYASTDVSTAIAAAKEDAAFATLSLLQSWGSAGAITDSTVTSDLVTYFTTNFLTQQINGTYAVKTSEMRQFLNAAVIDAPNNDEFDVPQIRLKTAAGGKIETIISTLTSALGEDAITSMPGFPEVAKHAGGAASVERLGALINEGMAEVRALGAAFTALDGDRLKLAARSAFAAAIGSSFPTGTDPILLPRTYVYTYVSDRGEESEPSDPSTLIDVDQNDTVIVEMAPPPVNRNVVSVRLYRSATGSQSSAFQFHSEYPPPTGTSGDVLTTTSGISVTYPTLVTVGVPFVWSITGAKPRSNWTGTWKKDGIVMSTLGPFPLDNTGSAVYTDSYRYLEVGLHEFVYSLTNAADEVVSITRTVDVLPVRTALTVETVISDDLLAERLGEACPTFGWAEPPSNMKGIAAMPNGMLLGFTEDTVHVCEPYTPYAWPAKYDIPLESSIVGMVAFGQSVLVTTKSFPYIISGADSASLSADKLSQSEACVSKRSMVAIGGSAMYASPNGLVSIEGGVPTVITQSILSGATWQSYNPHTIVAASHEGKYVMSYMQSSGGRACLVFDLANSALTKRSIAPDAMFADKEDDVVYALVGTTVYNITPITGTSATGMWYSGQMQIPMQAPMAWLRVDSDFGAAVTVKIDGYRDTGELVAIYTSAVGSSTPPITNAKPVRMPAGRYNTWRVRVESAVPVRSVTIATSIEELKQVP